MRPVSRARSSHHAIRRCNAQRPQPLEQLFDYIINYKEGSGGGGIARMRSFLEFGHIVNRTATATNFNALHKSINSDWIFSSGIFGICSTRFRDLMNAVLQKDTSSLYDTSTMRLRITASRSRTLNAKFQQAMTSATQHIERIQKQDETRMKALTVSML